MGSGASVESPLEQMSAVAVGDFIAGIGPAYGVYKSMIIENAISGAMVVDIHSTIGISQGLSDLGVTNKMHCSVINSHFTKAYGEQLPTDNPGSTSPERSSKNVVNWTPPDVNVNDRVTRTPQALMSDLFTLQGLPVDPSDIDAAVEKIKKFTGRGIGNGTTLFDCFISYRVATDADLAEKLYYSLKNDGIHAFLDKKCLKSGMNWKDGFLQGLKSSRCFVALISSAALEKVRDFKQNHTYDNVLIEFETALSVRIFHFFTLFCFVIETILISTDHESN